MALEGARKTMPKETKFDRVYKELVQLSDDTGKTVGESVTRTINGVAVTFTREAGTFLRFTVRTGGKTFRMSLYDTAKSVSAGD